MQVARLKTLHKILIFGRKWHKYPESCHGRLGPKGEFRNGGESGIKFEKNKDMGEKGTRDVWMLGTLERGEVVARYDDVSGCMWWNHVANSSVYSLELYNGS